MAATPSIPKGLDDDPDVRDRARRLLLAAYDHALELLEDGDPSTKREITRSLLPTLGRAMRDRSGDEEMAALRLHVDEAYDVIRGVIGIVPSPDPLPTAPPDDAPAREAV